MALRLAAFGLRVATPTTAVTGGVNTSIAGLHGTLHSAGGRQLHLPVDGEQHHGEHHRRVRLHDQGRRRRPVDDDADDQPDGQRDHCARRQRRDGQRGRAGYDDQPAPTLRPGRLRAAWAPAVQWRPTRATSSPRRAAVPVTYALVSGGNAATAGTYGTHPGQRERQLCLHADQPVRHHAGRRQRRQHGPRPRASPMW